MNGSYAESSVKKKVTTTDTMKKVGLITLAVVCLLAGLVVHLLMLVVGMAMIGLCFYLIPKFDIMYEYIFCDGQMDFDKIMGGAKRKNMLRVDFEKVVAVAPANSHALDGYRHDKVKVYDFSSLEPDHKKYGLVTKEGNQSILVYFEPDEKMVEVIKKKDPRKFSEY